MHQHVQVRAGDHPDTPVELQVKDKTVALSADEARELAGAIMDLAGVPTAEEPPEVPPADEETTDAPPA